MTNKTKTWFKRGLSSLTLITLLMSINVANAAILFQDDTFHDIASEGILLDNDGAGANNTTIQFGNDGTASENGNIVWDITANEFQFDHTVDITGDLDVSGNADFTDATQFHLREVADEAAAACTTIDELVLDTTENRIYVCTATGTPGTWTASDAGSADDFETVYSTDADDTLTTSNGNFSIAAGSGEFDVTSTGLIDFNPANFQVDTTAEISLNAGAASDFTVTSGDLSLTASTNSVNIDGAEAAADAVNIDASNAAGGIDIDAGTGGIAIDTTGALSLQGVSNSDFTTTTGDITFVAGDDLIFDDAQLTGIVQLSVTDTDWAATFSGDGIIDNINSFTLTTAGNGASNVGLEAGSLTNVTPGSNDVQAALEALDAVVGAAAPNGEDLTFYPEYPDTVIFKDGSNNRGRLDSDYDDTNDEHYYHWTSRNGTTQDIDLRFRFPLPVDFADVNDFTYRYRTGTATEADNDVEISVYNATDETTGDPTLCGADTTNGTAGAWATGTITEATIEAGCTGGTVLDAGDIIEILVKLLDNSGSADYADIGYIKLDYDN